jgi:alpha-glucoside transport system substrate-binding protein
VWSGPEFDSFVTVKSAWENDTGGRVDWEGTQDLPTALDARLQAGNPPDIAILPNLRSMQDLARRGALVPLNSVLDMGQVTKDYAPAWIDLGSYNGKVFGIFYKVANKATVWYGPKAFAAAHYSVPQSWKDLIALADRMVAGRRTPFSIVAPSGPALGWALTDWISQIVLNDCGPNVYDRWIAAEIPWTDACIRQSFDMFTRIIRTKGYVRGGAQGIVSTTDADGASTLYTNPPGAYMYYLASFAQGFIASAHPDLKAGEDYSFFLFPSIDRRYAGAVTVGADVVAMVHDSPAARSFMAYLAGARAQEAWIRLGGFTSVNRSVPPNTYLDPVASAVARDLTGAKVSRFSAGDMMPASLQRAWWAAMVRFVQDPSTVDSILHSLTRISRSTR